MQEGVSVLFGSAEWNAGDDAVCWFSQGKGVQVRLVLQELLEHKFFKCPVATFCKQLLHFLGVHKLPRVIHLRLQQVWCFSKFFFLFGIRVVNHIQRHQERHAGQINNNPIISCLPAVKDSAVGVLLSFKTGATVAGVLLVKKLFLTAAGEGVGLGPGLCDGDWVGVVPLR